MTDSSADLLRGQVTQAGTGSPINGALVDLYTTPPGATPDITVTTGILGLYETTEALAATEYEARVSHPGYITDISSFTMDADPKVENFELVPKASTPDGGLEIHVQVYGATTMLELRGCPVTWVRFADASTSSVEDSGTLLTDGEGYVLFAGLESGFYEFRVNDAAGGLPGWHSVSATAGPTAVKSVRYDITDTSALNVLLKPVESDLAIHVTGYDFVKDTVENEDLGDILVEITAVDPLDPTRVLMPPISDLTDGADPPDPTGGLVEFGTGKVIFNKLPPVAYEVRIKEIGYFEYVDVISPLPDGTLPVPPPIVLAPEENVLLVAPVFPGYKNDNELPMPAEDGIGGLGLEVNLIGLDGTETEGIKRRNFVKPTPPFGKALADFRSPFFVFDGDFPMPVFPGPSFLKPGRYKLLVSGYIEEPVGWSHPGGSDFDNRISLAVSHEEIVEIEAVGPEFFGIPGFIEERPVDLPVTPVALTGRLFKADDCDAVRGEPIYEPLGSTAIKFVQPHGLEVLMGTPTFTTTTDAHGNYAIDLPPGIYALRIPSAAGYAGGRIERTTIYSADPFRVGETTSESPLLNARWPFADPWPDALGNTEKVLRYFNGNGVAINGHDVQTLDLFLHKNVISVDALVTEHLLGPTARRLVAIDDTSGGFVSFPNSRLANSGATLDFVETGGTSFPATLTPNRPREGDPSFLGDKIRARWSAIPPGSYSPAFSNPGFTLSGSFGPDVFYPDFPLPGGVPDPATATLLGTLAEFERPLRPLERVGGFGFSVTEDSIPNGITYLAYNAMSEEYEPVASGPTPTFIQLTGGGPSGESGYFIGADLPAAEGHYWIKAGSSGYWKIPHNGTLKFGGPVDENTPFTALPDLKFDLKVRTLAIEDDNTEIGGVTLNRGGATRTTATGSPATWTGLTDFQVIMVDDTPPQNWIGQPQNAYLLPEVESATSSKVVLKQDFYVERGVEIRVDVTHDDTADPIPDVPVTIYNRYGAFQKFATTATDGKVTITALPGYQGYFVDINYPGFKPVRESFAPADLMEDDGQKFYDAAIELVPLASPAVTAAPWPFNRRGSFLPGVTRSGDQGVSDLFSAKETLTADWALSVMPATVTYSMKNFDALSGTDTGSTMISETDLPRAVYLIDRRKFHEIGGQGEEDLSTVFTLPDDSDPHLMRVFLRNLTNREFGEPVPKLYAKVTRDFSPMAPTTSIAGKLRVWELPTGTFKPAFIVETTRGAYTTFTPTITATDYLAGTPIPEWLGFAFDLLGFASGFSATQETIAKYVPDADIIPFPEFSASIAAVENPPESGKSVLNYTYELKVGGKIGQESPKSGMAKFLPAITGATAEGTVSITSDGAKGALGLSLSGSFSGDFPNGEDWTPLLVKPLNPEVKVNGSVSLTTTASKNVNPVVPHDVRLTSRRTAKLGLKSKMDMTPVTGKIPYAGPVIIGLSKVGALTNDATFRGDFTVSTLNCFETLKPPAPAVTGSVSAFGDPDPRNRRRSFLGGQFCESNGETTYAMTLAVGMELGLNGPFGFGLDGKGEVELENFTVVPNAFGDWPPVKRISGAMNILASGTIRNPIRNFSRSYKWNLLAFDAQYGTETVVQLVPMEVVTVIESLAAGGPSIFSAMAPQLVKNASPLSWFDINSSDPDTLVYPTYNSETGVVDLILAKRGEGLAWITSATVASVAEAGPIAMVRIPDGRLLVAWLDPAGTGLGDPFAPMDILYSIGDATDTTFSAPAVLVSSPGGLGSLELHVSGGTIACFTVLQSGGYSSPTHELFGMTFDPAAGTWTAPIPIDTVTAGYEELTILSSGSAGPAEFGIAAVDSDSILSFALWDGVAPSPTPTVLDTMVAGGLAGHLDATGHVLVAAKENGSLNRYDRAAGPGMAFAPPVSLASATAPLEATLVPRPTGGFLYTFTSATPDGSEILAIGFDASNALVAGSPVSITANPVGGYHELRTVSPLGGIVHLCARYSGDANHEIRVIEISGDLLLDGNDSDGDGLNDLVELRIIDADESDGIAMVGDVLGADDFDGDGFSNAREALEGSDPADPNSTPPQSADLAAWLIARGYPAGSNLSLDDDFNGWDLGQEYAFGIEPGTAPGDRHPTLEASGSNLRYQFTRRPGVLYVIQRGDPLLSGTWTEIVPLSTTVISTNPDGTENVVVEFATPGAPEFVRAQADISP